MNWFSFFQYEPNENSFKMRQFLHMIKVSVQCARQLIALVNMRQFIQFSVFVSS